MSKDKTSETKQDSFILEDLFGIGGHYRQRSAMETARQLASEEHLKKLKTSPANTGRKKTATMTIDICNPGRPSHPSRLDPFEPRDIPEPNVRC